jgi:hypothetical protein
VDEWIVFAGQDQRRLADEANERQARPAEHRELLVQQAAWAHTQVAEEGVAVRVRAKGTAIEARCHVPRVNRIFVPSRGQHLPQDRQPARNRGKARAGADKDEAAALSALLEGEVLSQRAAPGDTEDVRARMPELAEDPGDQAAHPGEPIGQ